MNHEIPPKDRYKVLSVDDEPVVHAMVGRIIGESCLPAMLVGAATSAEEALEAVARLRPDIVLLDIHMQGMDGIELGKRLAQRTDYHPVIIYLTAYDLFDHARQAIKLGAADYVLKPINRKELVDALGRVVNSLQAQEVEDAEQEELKRRVSALAPALLNPESVPERSRHEEIARTIQQYIDENYARKLTLADIAGLVCLSSEYAGSIFKSVTGFTFRSYLRSVRIVRAKELMRDQSLSLTQVAQMVGYNEVNYFSQAFLDETGMRPSEYRGGGKRWAK